MKYRYLTVLVFFCLSSCVDPNSVTQTQQKTWVEVYARYLDSDQLYKVEFTFLRGDTLAIAKSFALDGSVNVMNQTLDGRKLSPQLIRYQKDFKGDFNGKLEGKIADEAIAFKNLSLDFKQIPGYEVLGDTLNTKLGGTITFPNSLNLLADEELLIMVNDQNKQTVNLPIKGPFEIQKLIIPKDYLKELAPTQEGSLYLIAKKQGSLEENKQIMNYLLEHYSAERKIRLLE